MYNTNTPMPGQTTFSADEEQQMRNSQATINALARQGNSGQQASATPTSTTPEAGLNPAAYGAGKALGGLVGSIGSGGGGSLDQGTIGGTGGGLGGVY